MQKSISITNHPTDRASNFELLRIIAMLMIVASHFSYHSGFVFDPHTITLNRLWLQGLTLGSVGVNVFVLISGYFLCVAKNFSITKTLKLWATTFFYTILFLFLFAVVGKQPFSFRQLISSIFPIIHNAYWFISTYFVLYLLHPFINVFIQHVPQEKYQKLLLLLTGMWCLIPAVFVSKFQGNNLTWFIYLYLVAAYIRLYTRPIPARHCFLGALLVYVILVVMTVALDIIGMRVSIVAQHTLFFFDKYRLFIPLISLLLFLGFKNIYISSSKRINFLAAATLGIYLIHENTFVRPFLWKTFFHNTAYTDSAWLIPYSIGVILLVFGGCALIELFRMLLIERIYKKPLEHVANALETGINRLCSMKLFRRL